MSSAAGMTLPVGTVLTGFDFLFVNWYLHRFAGRSPADAVRFATAASALKLTIPGLILAMAVASALGPGIQPSRVLAIGIVRAGDERTELAAAQRQPPRAGPQEGEPVRAVDQLDSQPEPVPPMARPISVVLRRR